MKWPDLQRRYYEFRRSVGRVHLLGMATREAMESFPEKLPDRVGHEMKTAWLAARQKLSDFLERMQHGDPSRDLDFDELTPPSPQARSLWMTVMDLFAIRGLRIDGSDTRHLQAASIAQEYVLQIAALDAFLSDCLRASCTRVPRITALMKRGETSIERFVFVQSYGGLSGRLDVLLQGTAPTTATHADNLRELVLAWEIRNIAVHNAGLVSDQFVKRTGARGVVVGQPWRYDAAHLEVISHALRDVGHDLMLRVASLAFGLTAGEAIKVDDGVL